MGRHVAGESFLRGSLTFWFQIRSLDPGREEKAYNIFKSISNSCGRYEDIHAITRPKLHKLRTPGCLFLQDLVLVSGLVIDLPSVIPHGVSAV